MSPNLMIKVHMVAPVLHHLILEKCQMKYKLKLKTLILDKSTFGRVINSKINLWWWEMLFKLTRIENSKSSIQPMIHSMKNKSQSYLDKLSTCLKVLHIRWIIQEKFRLSPLTIKFMVNWQSTLFHAKKMEMKV